MTEPGGSSVWWRALIASLREPRTITALTVFSYLYAAVLGAYFVFDPPSTMTHAEAFLRISVGVIFVACGIIGMPSAWAGYWWIERVAALGCAGAAALTFVVVIIANELRTLLEPGITGLATLIVIIHFVMRFIRVKSEPFAPGHGPVTIVEQSNLDAMKRSIIDPKSA